MEREFIIFKSFERAWKDCGFTDEDLRELQNILCQDPKQGVVIPGTGGIRKLRWGIEEKGKRSGARTIYIDFALYEEIYLLTAYPKNVKEDMTEEEKKNLRKVVEAIKAERERKRIT